MKHKLGPVSQLVDPPWIQKAKLLASKAASALSGVNRSTKSVDTAKQPEPKTIEEPKAIPVVSKVPTSVSLVVAMPSKEANVIFVPPVSSKAAGVSVAVQVEKTQPEKNNQLKASNVSSQRNDQVFELEPPAAIEKVGVKIDFIVDSIPSNEPKTLSDLFGSPHESSGREQKNVVNASESKDSHQNVPVASSGEAKRLPESYVGTGPSKNVNRPQSSSFGFNSNRGFNSSRGYDNRNGSQRLSRPTSTNSAIARAEFEALFSGKPAQTTGGEQSLFLSAEKATSQPASTIRAIYPAPPAAQVHPAQRSLQPHQGPAVVVKRKHLSLDGISESQMGQLDESEKAIAPPIEPSVAQKLPEIQKETAVRRTFLIPYQTVSAGFDFGASRNSEAKADYLSSEEPDPMSSRVLSEPRGLDLPPNVRIVAQDSVGVQSMKSRLETMSPEQIAAWLMVSPDQNLKPFSHEVVRLMIQGILSEIDDDALHAIHPVSHWIIEPATEISLYSDGKYRRNPRENIPSVLPGQIGVWVSANKLSGTESTKRSVNAQRINAISLAGILMASNRLEAMEWMLAERLDPLKVAARLGCAPGMENKGHDVGEINGYAISLLAHSNQFFNWCMQGRHLLCERAKGRANEMSSALYLAIKVWSFAHGEFPKDCAEMTAVMLQIGANLSEWALMAFAPHGRRQTEPSVAWARFCSQTFGIDSHGEAVKRVIENAKIQGFSLHAGPGEPQPMMPYAQANLDEAVAVFLRAGFDPNLKDALGQTVMDRAKSARADRVIALLQAYDRGDLLPEARELTLDQMFQKEPEKFNVVLAQEAPKPPEINQKLLDLMKEKESLQNLIDSMESTYGEIVELDRWIGMEVAH